MANNNVNLSADAEWKRIMGNPDNVIISDSLVARIDPYSLGEIENPSAKKPSCHFTFEGYTLAGDVISFSNSSGQRSYTFSTTLLAASQLMNSANFVSFKMLSGDDELVTIGKKEISNLNFNVDVQNSTTALVTISFNEIAQ